MRELHYVFLKSDLSDSVSNYYLLTERQMVFLRTLLEFCLQCAEDVLPSHHSRIIVEIKSAKLPAVKARSILLDIVGISAANISDALESMDFALGES